LDSNSHIYTKTATFSFFLFISDVMYNCTDLWQGRVDDTRILKMRKRI